MNEIKNLIKSNIKKIVSLKKENRKYKIHIKIVIFFNSS